MAEIEAEMLAKLDAQKAAAVSPSYTPLTRLRFSRYQPMSAALAPLPTTGRKSGAFYKRARAEKAAKQAETDKRTAVLLAWSIERKAEREDAEKRAAERKVNGTKLSFEDWKREVMGE